MAEVDISIAVFAKYGQIGHFPQLFEPNQRITLFQACYLIFICELRTPPFQFLSFNNHSR